MQTVQMPMASSLSAQQDRSVMDLFILPSAKEATSFVKCTLSFGSLLNEGRVKDFPSIQAINKFIERKEYADEKGWFFVIYDNEYLSKPLREAISILMDNKKMTVFSFMKRDAQEQVSKSPRMFKKGICLEDNSLLPKNLSSMNEHLLMLDGFIKEVK